MLNGSCLVLRVYPIFSFISRYQPTSLCWNFCNILHPIAFDNAPFSVKHALQKIPLCYFSLDKPTYMSSSFISAASAVNESSTPSSKALHKKSKKACRDSPENVLLHKLNVCSKNGDIIEALRLYDEARKNGIQMNQHIYNLLLYLCSSFHSSAKLSVEKDLNLLSLGANRGFEIFQQMIVDKVDPNEATFTSVARLAILREDPDMAFDLVKQMKTIGLAPKLRSYGPPLFSFCERGDAIKAYEVDAHMIESGVVAEEPEVSALLKLSADAKRGDKVYEMLHRLRVTVRQVSESTLEIIRAWFNSEDAEKIGLENWDVDKVREGIVKGGGGWHGQGWLGTGRWQVVRTQMDKTGMCHSCSGKLVSIDIDPRGTENFATSLTRLAHEREVKADFKQFQDWLQQHGPFDAVVDGANIGLIKQHHFSFFQLKSVVQQLRQMSPSKKLPLVILHRSRVTGGPAQYPSNKKLLEFWNKSGALYATPSGSNDDWYWLYAAVSCKCLIITNDEMRDHLFQLLGNSFFPRWKEKHQVRLSVSSQDPVLHLPPPYSIVVQESANGSWHVPTVIGDDIETPRQWLCATRARNSSSVV